MSSLRNMVVDAAASVGADATGSAVRVDKTKQFCIACVISGGGSPVGALKVQASLDTASPPASTSWFDVDGTEKAVAADGAYGLDVYAVNYIWARSKFTRTSGTGSMTTTFNENV